MAGRIQDAQSSCTGSESASYCSHLLRQGRGFPLYTPGPPGNSPVEYQRNGVSIGDVGRITADGVFDFFFNIYLDAEDPINADFVPDDFVPLGLYKPRDVRPQEFDPGNWVSSAFIQVSDLDAHWDCTGPNGAVLALPHGAHLQKLENVEPVRQYAAKYAESWYRYLNRERGRGLANGSLYLITGWEKSQSGGMASFQNISPETSFQLSFVPTTDAENGYNYRFKKGTPAFTKHFASHSHGEQAPPNQTTFLHGFSISLGEALWWKLFRDANIFEISDSRMRNSQNALMSFDIFSWLFKFSSWLFGSRDAATSGKEEIAISDLSPTREVSVHTLCKTRG
ncbi:hypothetical protein B0H13DRAFT_1649247 [Mycena leptocephala]|nr:hypothetical protein B0H13DRAFT_1649247 [Mycena leptocephala]